MFLIQRRLSLIVLGASHRNIKNSRAWKVESGIHMANVNQNTSEKIELLKFFYEDRIGEVIFLRERQEKIFAWSSNIFMALIGALLIIEPSKSPVWAFTVQSKVVASIAIVFLIIFSVRWQQRTRQWHNESGQVIQSMQKLLHCYEKGYFDPSNDDFTLFPLRWSNSEGEKPRPFFQRMFAANFVSATVILGILTIAMIWIRN